MKNYKLKNGKMKNYEETKTSKKHQKRRRRGPGPLLKDAACKIMYYSSGIMHLRRFGRQFCSKTSEIHKKTICFRTKQQKRPRKSAWIHVLMLGKDRADFTENVAGIPAQIRWLELEQWPFEVRKKRPK